MVHALEEVWRLLKPGGMLVDLRPIVSHPPVDVIGGEGEARAGRLNDSSDSADQEACERALKEVQERGWFGRGTADQFIYSMVWDTPQEMLEYLAANWEGVEVPEDVVIKTQLLADVAVYPVEVRILLTMAIATYERLGL